MGRSSRASRLSLSSRSTSRNQELAAVDRLRQPDEGVAVAQEIRAHGHADVDGKPSLLRQAQQQGDECLGLAAGIRILAGEPESKKLLELVHEQQQVGAGRVFCLVEHVEQGVRAFVDHALGDGLGIMARFPEGRLEGDRQVPERCLAWLHGGDAPEVPVLDQEARLQGRDKSGSDQGGLAAAGAAHHRQEAAAVEQL
jgi:hypothetical protein